MCFLILLLGLLCHFQQIVEVNTVGPSDKKFNFIHNNLLIWFEFVNEKNIMKRILYVFMQIHFHWHELHGRYGIIESERKLWHISLDSSFYMLCCVPRQLACLESYIGVMAITVGTMGKRNFLCLDTLNLVRWRPHSFSIIISWCCCFLHSCLQSTPMIYQRRFSTFS